MEISNFKIAFLEKETDTFIEISIYHRLPQEGIAAAFTNWYFRLNRKPKDYSQSFVNYINSKFAEDKAVTSYNDIEKLKHENIT